jgi:diguanylate cyclase (GGDEF)-like protein
MTPAYLPTPEIVQEYLEYVQQTVHEPAFHTARAIELLLGLRDAKVDRDLVEIAPGINSEHDVPSGIRSGDLIGLAEDPSVQRFVRLLTRHDGVLSLAWLTLAEEEVREFIEGLLPYWAAHKEPNQKTWLIVAVNRFLERFRRSAPTPRWQPGSLQVASLCDLVVRFGDAQARDLLRELPTKTWLERTTWERTFNEGSTRASLTEEISPPWAPQLPPAFIRDSLTGLYRRAILYEDVHRHYLPEGRRLTEKLPAAGVILLDVDHMININDRYGFRAGDTVLRALAEQLQTLVGDRVIRFGGDEQLILWEFDNADVAAQKIVDSVRSMKIDVPDSPEETVSITVSAGVASGLNASEVLHAADEALYRAKCAGRDRLEVA